MTQDLGQPDNLMVQPRAGRCSYCGSALSPEFYFCTICATPYRDVEWVLPKIRPAQPTLETLVKVKAPHAMPLFFLYLGVIIGSAILSLALFGSHNQSAALLFETGAIFVLTCIIAVMHWQALAVQLRRFGLLKWQAWAALALLVPLIGLNVLWHEWLGGALGLKADRVFSELRDSGLGRWGMVLLFCVFPAVTEELAFRGLLQHWLQVAVRPMLALMLASGLFAALHFSVYSFPYLMLVGMLLGWAKWQTGSLYPSMLIHFLHNLIVVELF